MAHAATVLGGAMAVPTGRRSRGTGRSSSGQGSLLPAHEAADLVELARKADKGLLKVEVAKLFSTIRAVSSIPLGKLRAQLIPDSTWKRAGKRLGPQSSQTAARLQRVFGFAQRIFVSERDAAIWLTTPHMELGWKTPFSLLRTEAGGCAVEGILAAIEYGFPV
jgi:putative toxin-antitoxin system antitoxin component (TIGR02293 family)